MKLILHPDWRELHKRVTVIVPGVLGAISAFGPEIRDAWRAIPDDLKTVIPAHVQQAISYAIFFCALIGANYVRLQRAPAATPPNAGDPQ